jgi:4a-hydroxytetrahydrobiopterin dehydratase
LKHLKCVPCRGGELPLAEDKIQELISQVPEWEVIEVEGIKRLQRTFKFKNFVQALGFTNRVGEIAEQQDHHPVLITQWGKVTVTWWTHVIKGLHQNDFIMAAKTEELYSE